MSKIDNDARHMKLHRFLFILAGLVILGGAVASPLFCTVEEENSSLENDHVIIPVNGMTCPGCEQTVQAALKNLPGVAGVQTSRKSQSAFVIYDPSAISPEQIAEAIGKTGYQAGKPIRAEERT